MPEPKEHVTDGFCRHCGSRVDELGYSLAEDGGVETEDVSNFEAPTSEQRASTDALRKAALMDKLSKGGA